MGGPGWFYVSAVLLSYVVKSFKANTVGSKQNKDDHCVKWLSLVCGIHVVGVQPLEWWEGWKPAYLG